METNAHHYSLLLALILVSIVALELYTPHGAAFEARGSTSHHAGSAGDLNDTVPVGDQLSPPTALTYIVHMENGSTMTASVPFPQINYSFVPPGIPILAVIFPNICIPHLRPPPLWGSPGTFPRRGQSSPIPWLH